MKMIRNITILVGLSVVLFALAVTGARAQTFASTSFTGSFTLPAETHWGALTLPTGDYTLSYGIAFSSTYLVAVAGKAEGSPRAMILPGSRNDVKSAENVLNCIREGDTLYVRALEMPLIGQSVHFRIPHGVEVRSRVSPIAKNHGPSGKTSFTQEAIRIERVPAR
jgi:hypothetical protein